MKALLSIKTRLAMNDKIKLKLAGRKNIVSNRQCRKCEVEVSDKVKMSQKKRYYGLGGCRALIMKMKISFGPHYGSLGHVSRYHQR